MIASAVTANPPSPANSARRSIRRSPSSRKHPRDIPKLKLFGLQDTEYADQAWAPKAHRIPTPTTGAWLRSSAGHTFWKRQKRRPFHQQVRLKFNRMRKSRSTKK